ncbi:MULTISPECIES: DUF624 domain-containing protein [Lactobacillus]|uniref:DUF624 domain-containing protein n=1 Tax=Lactobacillus xujianguonis TaxID=2495899 RepID=A0A437SV00_9LACO|nr:MULTISPECIES: DUF624 domain-containing protein [Lactobacillus]RVU70756.1 DUF624 domain-containing protein [Lactobacillus xujianguonis]RVU73981.1 DUF624 domain-containing protein [Lactobacillus xujianguonis]
MNQHRKNFIYTGIQIAWRLILGNIFFLISNLVLLILSFSVKFTLMTTIFYLVASITVFPSLVALVSYLRNDEVEDKIGLGAKVYFNSFKDAFKTGWQSGLIYEVVIIFLLVDIASANKLMKNGQFFLPLLMLLVVLTLIHAMWNLLVQNYFYVDLKEGFTFATKLLMKKPLVSLMMILLIFGDYISFKMFPQYAVLFIIPLTAYVLWKMTLKDFTLLKQEVVIKK